MSTLNKEKKINRHGLLKNPTVYCCDLDVGKLQFRKMIQPFVTYV